MIDRELGSAIDAWLTEENRDYELDQIAWENEQERIYEEMKERGMLNEPF